MRHKEYEEQNEDTIFFDTIEEDIADNEELTEDKDWEEDKDGELEEFEDGIGEGAHGIMEESKRARQRRKPGKKVRSMIVKYQAVCAFLALISLIGAAFGVTKLLYMQKEYAKGTEVYEDSREYVNVILPGLVASDANDIISDGDQVNLPFDINFAELKNINPDVCAWIYIEDTKVDYPVVYSHDNSDYLKKTYDLQTNNAGAIFVDCACNSNFTSANTIIYGHNMKNGSMFRAINDYVKESFYQEHRYVWICTESSQIRYRVIATYQTEFYSDAYQRDFIIGSDEYATWLDNHTRSSYYYTTPADRNLPTVTLSTCVQSGTEKRMILVLQPDEIIRVQ